MQGYDLFGGIKMMRGLQKKNVILKTVEGNPGISFLDIQRNTGYANGVISHHLNTLENEGIIRIKRKKRKMGAFHHTLDEHDDDIQIILRKETCKKVVVFLLENKTADAAHIQDAIDKNYSTTTLTLRMLVANNLIKRIRGFPKRYVLEDPEKIRLIITP